MKPKIKRIRIESMPELGRRRTMWESAVIEGVEYVFLKYHRMFPYCYEEWALPSDVDYFREQHNATERRGRNRRKASKILRDALDGVSFKGVLENRVAFHVRRGRDASSIAVRERIPVSVVLGVMAKIAKRERGIMVGKIESEGGVA